MTRCCAPTDICAADAASLKALFELTAGESWTDHTNWCVTSLAATWFGVTVANRRVTKIELPANNLVGNVGTWKMPTGLETLDLYFNTSVSGNVSGWILPTSLLYFRIKGTVVSGNIGGWVLPASLSEFYIGAIGTSVDIIGDISGWVLPASLTWFSIASTAVSGDISGWVLPATLVSFSVNSTAVSGNISGWVLPATLTHFYINNTSVSGNIGSWVLPTPLVEFVISSTSVSGDISGWVIPGTLQMLSIYGVSGISGAPLFTSAVQLNQFRYNYCSLLQATVDLIASRIYARRVSFTNAAPYAFLEGNAAPSGTYADEDPPTTGKGYIYELMNDPEVEGFNKWIISYTA